MGFLISLVLVVGCLTGYIKYWKDVDATSTIGDSTSFSPWLYVLSTLFEETNSVPSVLEEKIYYRLVFGIWAIVAVVFTNFYNGIMIENLIATLPRSEIKSWNDIICERNIGTGSIRNVTNWTNSTVVRDFWYQVVSNIYLFYGTGGIEKPKKLRNPLESENCFRLLSAPSVFPSYFKGPAWFPPNKFFKFLLGVFQKIQRELSVGNLDIPTSPEMYLLSPKHGRELSDLSERNQTMSKKEISELFSNHRNFKMWKNCVLRRVEGAGTRIHVPIQDLLLEEVAKEPGPLKNLFTKTAICRSGQIQYSPVFSVYD
ncbi:hypothetical protein Fcan01_24198 [Folsomia candida]|uniref:Ionotropic glutamate receptor C-terminal domain-containing protein n=1 Tax=Folsomia candida TaxID=158441 RepID=A0A226D6Y2_FOLCA|nr:hypothetical protein Fcan01_24198 [Folsomia candida]